MKKVTDGMKEQTGILRKQGLSWYMISKIFMIAPDTIRRAMDNEYRKKRNSKSLESYFKHHETRKETMRKYINNKYNGKKQERENQ